MGENVERESEGALRSRLTLGFWVLDFWSLEAWIRCVKMGQWPSLTLWLVRRSTAPKKFLSPFSIGLSQNLRWIHLFRFLIPRSELFSFPISFFLRWLYHTSCCILSLGCSRFSPHLAFSIFNSEFLPFCCSFAYLSFWVFVEPWTLCRIARNAPKRCRRIG